MLSLKGLEAVGAEVVGSWDLSLGFGLLHGSGAPAWSVRTVAGARDSQVLKTSRMNTPPKGSPGEQHRAQLSPGM